MSFLDPKVMRFAMAMSSATISMGLLMYGGYRLGTWLDIRWGTTPYLMLGLLLLGLFCGVAWLIQVANRTKL